MKVVVLKHVANSLILLLLKSAVFLFYPSPWQTCDCSHQQKMARGKTTAEGNPNKHHLVCSFYVLCWDTEMPWTKCSLGHHAGEGTHRPWNLQSSLSSAMQPHSRHARQEGEGAVLEVSSPAPAVTVPRCLDHLQLRPEMWVRDKHPCSALHY